MRDKYEGRMFELEARLNQKVELIEHMKNSEGKLRFAFDMGMKEVSFRPNCLRWKLPKIGF